MESNSDLVVVLHIKEAINLNKVVNQHVMLTASLDKSALETPVFPQGNSILIDSNLLWETDRKSVKRMKTEYLPIKIECFSIDRNAKEQEKELIGHLIMPLRNVPIIPANKVTTIKSRWYRLIGLSSEWKNCKPELLIFAIITDKSYIEGEKQEIGENFSNESVVIYDDKESEMLQSQQGLFIKLLSERGLLQVGSIDLDCDVFLVKIVIKNAKFLDELLPDSESALEREYHIRYVLLGKEFRSKLEKKMNNTFNIQEKIVINFRTSLKALNEYFDKVFFVPIEFYCGEKLVGNSILRLSNLIKWSSIDEFFESCSINENVYEEEVFSQINSLQEKVVEGSDENVKKPSVRYKFHLKYVLNDKEIAEDKIGGGDNSVSRPVTAQKVLNSLKQTPFLLPTEKTDIDSILMCEDKDLRDVPRTFSYNLVLQNAKFNKKQDNGIWQISFQHPKAETPFTKTTLELQNVESETVDFDNLELQLYFSSMPDKVLDTIISDSCRVTVSGPHGVYAFAELNNQNLVIGSKEKQAGVIFLDNSSGENVAMANIFVYLDELGINYNSNIRKLDVAAPRPVMDEELTCKFVEELEEWKIKQKELFLVEMKKKEVKLLTKLASEWKRKKMKDEKELSEKLEKCSVLTAALEETQRNLKEKGLKKIEQEKIINDTKASLEKCYNNQLLAIKENARRIEDDLSHTIKLQELKQKELESTNLGLEKENDKLRDVIIELETEIERLKINNVTKEQVSGLFQDLKNLNELCENVQKSKLFYKEQWAKSIREIHKMKSGTMHHIKEQYFGLFDYLASEKQDLESEKDELDSVRQIIFP